MNKILQLLFFSGFGLIAFGQTPIVAKQLKAAQLPKQAKFRGKLSEAWQWKDKSGDNILVLSKLGPVSNPVADEDAKTVELFAYQYCKKDTAYKLVWRLNDLVKECPLDLVAEFIKGSVSVTDIDKDGIAETIVQYKLACRGDVSPSSMKLIMHEDSVKYALRGSMWLHGAVAEAPFEVTEKNVNLEKLTPPADESLRYIQGFGRYETERGFANAPAGFLEHARKRWLKFAKETD